MNDLLVAYIVEFVGKKLTYLDISECSRCTDMSLLAIAENATHLCRLGIRRIPSLSRSALEEVLFACCDLVAVDLRRCPSLDVKNGVHPLKRKYPSVEFLRVSGKR